MRLFANLGLGALLCIGSAACDSGETAPPGSGGATAGAGGSSGSPTAGVTSGAGTTTAVTSGSGSPTAAVTSSAGAGGATSGAGGSGATSSTTSTGSGMTVNCTDVSTAMGTLTKRYDGVGLDAGGSKSYWFQTNWWHKFDAEAEPYNGLSFTVQNPTNAGVPATDGAPLGYPSIFIGQYGGHTTKGSNLPKQVSALTSVPTIFKTNQSSIGLPGHNAAYDVWFTQANTPLAANQSNPGKGGAYLMVWLHKPTDRQPRGTAAGHTAETIAGVPGTWDVWIDNTDPPCISYVSTTPLDELSYDLNDFIKDSVTNMYGVTDSMYLSIVFGGFEIWNGGDGLQIKQFCAAVN